MANEKKESMQMFCVEDIVKRAKLVQGFKKDSQLASYLGISRSTLSNWLARNSIDFPLLLSRYSEVDYNWLLTGKGIPTRQRSLIDLGPSSGEAGHQSRAKLSEPLDNRYVTLYDISSTTDLKSLLENRSQEAAIAVLEKVGLSHRMRHFPTQLSGGQCQRVAIARAIIGNPEIILADEPTGNLDSKMGAEVMEILHKLNQEDGRTIVMVTHNENQAKQTSRIVHFFDGRQIQ